MATRELPPIEISLGWEITKDGLVYTGASSLNADGPDVVIDSFERTPDGLVARGRVRAKVRAVAVKPL